MKLPPFCDPCRRRCGVASKVLKHGSYIIIITVHTCSVNDQSYISPCSCLYMINTLYVNDCTVTPNEGPSWSSSYYS